MTRITARPPNTRLTGLALLAGLAACERDPGGRGETSDPVHAPETSDPVPAPEGQGADPEAMREQALAVLAKESRTPPKLRAENGRVMTLAMDVPVPPNPDAAQQAMDFLVAHGSVFGLDDPQSQLYLDRVETVGDERYTVFQQRQGELPIVGTALRVHIARDAVRMVNTDSVPPSWVNPDPGISAAEVERRLMAMNMGGPAGPATLGIYPSDPRGLRLSWRIAVEDGPGGIHHMAWLDAQTGELLGSEPLSYDDRDLDIMNGRQAHSTSCWAFAGTDDWFDAGGPLSTYKASDDPHQDGPRAFNSANGTYAWFSQWIDSFDNCGAEIEAVLRVVFEDENGNKSRNANAEGFCGTLNFSDFYPTQDTFTHEFVHLVTYESAGLIYYGEPGAISESMSDMLAATQTFDWRVGESRPAASTISGTLENHCSSTPPDNTRRDFVNPTRCGHPDHVVANSAGDKLGKREPTVSTPCKPAITDDYGGVHTNSAIPNKAGSLLALGGTHNGHTVRGIGVHRAAHLFMTVLRHGLTKWSSFNTLRDLMVIQANAWAEIGHMEFDAMAVCDVRNAYASVGIVPTGGDANCDGVEDFTTADDDDKDGALDQADNCPTVANPFQTDTDGDKRGNACDDDDDNDGVRDLFDKCQFIVDDQTDKDGDGRGEPCDDDDGDSVPNSVDNCPSLAALSIVDTDKDNQGDACDEDDDGDGINDIQDNCPLHQNGNEDVDNDGIGDPCDNCPTATNANQEDCDHDGIGAACEPLGEKPSCAFSQTVWSDASVVPVGAGPGGFSGWPLDRAGSPAGRLPQGVNLAIHARAPVTVLVLNSAGGVVTRRDLGPGHGTLRFNARGQRAWGSDNFVAERYRVVVLAEQDTEVAIGATER